MSERLTIDEIIEHCKRKVAKLEPFNWVNYFENGEMPPTLTREYWEHRQVAQYLKELKQYRNLKEQGLLLRLPVAVGTEVWTIMTGMTGKHPILFRQRFELSMVQYWGTSVFLTKVEAEEKLRELEGK